MAVFKSVAALILLSSGVVHAAEQPRQCLPTPVSSQQVIVQGEYGGRRLDFTVTIDGKTAPGFDAPSVKQAEAEDKTCPLTS